MRLPEPSRPPATHRRTRRPARLPPPLPVRSCPPRRPPHREFRPRPRQASQWRDIFLPAIV
jgi:hypothetical protein